MPGTYLPPNEQERATWLTTFATKLSDYATALGLSAGTVAGAVADAAYYQWTIQTLLAFRDYAESWTAYKNALINGSMLGAAPVVPTPGAAPALVAPDLLGRLGKLVTTIKNAPGYTAAIGKDLGIVGPETAKPDPNTLKPVLRPRKVAKGVELDWSKQGNRRLHLYLEVDRGTGWEFLALDTEPDYVDTHPVTAPATWKYRAQYRLGDEAVGVWSDVVSVVVG